MNNKRKYTFLWLCAVLGMCMLFALLCGCGTQSEPNGDDATDASADSQEQTETGTPSWAEGLEESGVGYYIKPVDYQAAAVDFFYEDASDDMKEIWKGELSELERSEGKELVSEIRNWCSQNLSEDSAGLCYQKGSDYWILYYNRNVTGLNAWCEPELTANKELKIRVCYTYAEGDTDEGVWFLEKISSPVSVTKIICYDDITYDVLFYEDFSGSSTDEDYFSDVSNLYGVGGSGGAVPQWDCRYVLHDLIATSGSEGEVDTSLKPEVIGDYKLTSEEKKAVREKYKKEWAGKDGLMVYKASDTYWIYYCDSNSKKDADVEFTLEGNTLLMSYNNDDPYMSNIEPYCWKLFAVKSPTEIKQIELTAGDTKEVVTL